MNKISLIIISFILLLSSCSSPKEKEERLTDYVNPFLGTATLWDKKDLGYTPTRRAWGAEVYPGSSLPNAMVQASPVTQFRSGAGYQYEDTVIYAFTHTNKGHWNLCHVPILPVTGEITPDNYYSPYSHNNESAHPGYYQVFLERYGVNAELTSTLRCAYHRHTFKKGDEKKLMFDLTKSNEGVNDWNLSQEGENIVKGFQQTGGKIHFYAVANYKIKEIESLKNDEKEIRVIHFEDESGDKPLEMKIGFSFVSAENAKENLEKEIAEKDFDQIRNEATDTWEALLSKIKISGSTDKQNRTFYSSLYRSFLWPALRSDVNGEYMDVKGEVVNNGFRYYTDPSFWDDYRNKLILLGMISPDVTTDVIKSLIDKGEKRGFMPTFFHGDHASTFVTGSYLRGIHNFDINKAYDLIFKNATVEGPSRPHLNKYMELGYVPEQDLKDPRLETVANAAVTKTLEYAYDDYSVALLAKELNKKDDYDMLMKRTSNYKNQFDPTTELMRGRLENGEWIKVFDPKRPFYEYMYREANAWQSSFFAPHDPEGLIALYKSKEAFENKLDSLFTIPWEGYEAHNLTVFIGQYCHGNQPDHSFPHMYYFVDKQEKSQAILDTCLNYFYNMGKEGLSLSGMDDAGEMSSWYVMNAIGLYTFSPADPEYLITVPLFDKVEFTLPDNITFTVTKKNAGRKITDISYDGQKVDGYFISHADLKKGKELIITTE